MGSFVISQQVQQPKSWRHFTFAHTVPKLPQQTESSKFHIFNERTAALIKANICISYSNSTETYLTHSYLLNFHTRKEAGEGMHEVKPSMTAVLGRQVPLATTKGSIQAKIIFGSKITTNLIFLHLKKSRGTKGRPRQRRRWRGRCVGGRRAWIAGCRATAPARKCAWRWARRRSRRACPRRGERRSRRRRRRPWTRSRAPGPSRSAPARPRAPPPAASGRPASAPPPPPARTARGRRPGAHGARC
jgi:hypothetical protein